MKELNDDLLDDGLQAVMGKDRCQDLPLRQKSEKEWKAVAKDSPAAAVDASWAPVKPSNYMDKIRECVKHGFVFAGISGLLFYWQQAGLLASSAAVPSLIICALGAGLTIGWHAR